MISGSTNRSFYRVADIFTAVGLIVSGGLRGYEKENPLFGGEKKMGRPSLMRHIHLSRPNCFALLAFAYISLLYAGSGWARGFQLWLTATLGDCYRWLPVLGCALFLAFILGRGVQSLRAHTQLTKVFVLLLMSCYVAVLYLLKIPAEKFHLVQYGILVWLVTEALTGRLVGWRLHLAALLIAVVVGVGDELVQWIRPNRVGDVRDIALNTVSALLAQGLLCVLSRAPTVK